MPHKHKRQKTGGENGFNLAPSSFAKSLPTGKKAHAGPNGTTGQTKKGKKRKAPLDDTPRAFKYLMRLQETGKGINSLDNGERVSKKRKREAAVPKLAANGSDDTNSGNAVKAEAKLAKQTRVEGADDVIPLAVPKIQPGERMSDFVARVNQALPLTGLTRKGKATVIDGKEIREGRRTKHEKKLRRLQAGWREEEARLKEKEEEEAEELEEQRDEQRALYGEDFANSKRIEANGGTQKKKKGKRDRSGLIEDDPWAVLKEKRGAQPAGVFDVAQEPPRLGKLKEKFKVRDGVKVEVDDIPNASAASLKRREDLVETRKAVIDRYRAMMQAQRAA